MSEPVSVARQATFSTEPADDTSLSEGSIRRGNIHIPVVTDTVGLETNLSNLDPAAPSNREQLHPSLASSTRSSPIYAAGGTSFKEFRANVLKNARPSRGAFLASQPSRPPSLGGDTTSELDILSDVGLAGDSDTDAPPPSGLSLSVSARRKIPKGEPRIKIPSAKTDNAEPTIQEETTQEVLNLAIDEHEKSTSQLSLREGDNISPQLLSRRPSVRSETIILERSPKRKKIVSFDVPDISVKTPEETQKSDENKFMQEVNKKAAHLAKVDPAHANSSLTRKNNVAKASTSRDKSQVNAELAKHLPLQASPDSEDEETQFNNSLDSSFYESDWQPRESASKSPRTTDVKADASVNHKSPAAISDSGEISDTCRQNNLASINSGTPKLNTVGECNSSERPSLNKNSTQSVNVQLERQEDRKVISHEYETKIKPVVYSRLDTGKRWTAGWNSDSKNDQKPKPPSTENKIDNISPVPDQVAHTPSDNSLNTDGEKAGYPVRIAEPKSDTDTGLTSDWNSEGASGVPKRKGLTSSVEIPETSPQDNKRTEPQESSNTKENVDMASSDAYGYESETFEEILKDRNDLVKAEKTYQRRIRQLEEELKGMVNQCQMLSDENKELRQKLDAAKKSQTENNQGSTVPNSDHVELASRVARLETEKENLSNKNEQLTQRLKESESKTKQFDSVFVENTKLKTKNVELEKRTATLNKELQLLSNRIQESESENESKINNADKNNKELRDVVSELQYENKSLKAKVNSKENDNVSLAAALEEKRTEVSEMMRAMQNETTTEVELRESHARLERAQEEAENVKKELLEMKQALQESEDGKMKLQKNLSQRDGETKKLKSEHEGKDKVIAELRGYLDRSKLEMKRLEDSQIAYRDMEKDSLYLKSRIASLKAEIESSLTENMRLKQEREEMYGELERLRVGASHTGEAVMESKKYFRKWENERDARNKVEVELGKRDDDVHLLETRLKEAANQLNSVFAKLKAAEEEKAHFANTSVQELSTNNKILTSENKKLRQMLVERNIELTHKSAEQNVFDSRIKMLERKQKDAEVRVKQLSGWVVNAEVTQISTNDHSSNKSQQSHPNNHHTQQQRRSNPTDASKSAPSDKASLPPRSNANNDQQRQQSRIPAEQRQVTRHFSDKSIIGVTEPKVAFVSPRARHKSNRAGAANTLTPPPEWEEPRKRVIDRESGANHTPLSLPSILDASTITPPDSHGGYFMLYKERVKRMQDRRF
ncbi:filamin a-interacting protein 1-like [Plakobranchus ocellatus]|uniref:Filamin a-interacting protein 1-like n=1 Tax=Plakobranchus ocellatus TaxID=259542 RepID=A0AAV4D2S4_9GAST|nr:filamin a-interacting protein 1-like [Plakobranchus ocellatus]